MSDRVAGHCNMHLLHTFKKVYDSGIHYNKEETCQGKR